MAEPNITREMKVADVLGKHPRTIGVFNRYGIDACCGGQRTIETSAAERNLDLHELIESLERCR